MENSVLYSSQSKFIYHYAVTLRILSESGGCVRLGNQAFRRNVLVACGYSDRFVCSRMRIVAIYRSPSCSKAKYYNYLMRVVTSICRDGHPGAAVNRIRHIVWEITKHFENRVHRKMGVYPRLTAEL